MNNESAEIIRILNTALNDILPEGEARSLDLYPGPLRAEIDELNAWVFETINSTRFSSAIVPDGRPFDVIHSTDGVYKAGFATTPEAYEANVKPLFASLDRVEKLLGGGKEFLVGDRLTEADIRLFTTIVRFDPVYHGHFKCNLGSIRVSKISSPRLRCWLTERPCGAGPLVIFLARLSEY